MIITISEKPGSGGEGLAESLASGMGYRLFNEKKLYEELNRNSIKEPVPVPALNSHPGEWCSFSEERDKYLHYLHRIILEFASDGDCVMAGRGTQIVFSGVPGVVKIRITAPDRNCALRFSEEHGCSPVEAGKVLRHMQLEREAFYKAFFHTNLCSCMLYDLVINTEFFDSDAVLSFIEEAVELKKDSDTRIADLRLENDVTHELLFTRSIRIHELNVFAEKGNVEVSGDIMDGTDPEACRGYIMQMPGVLNVDTELLNGSSIISSRLP